MSDTVKRVEVTQNLNVDGRLLIPSLIRKAMGISPGDPVDLNYENGVLTLRKHEPEENVSPDKNPIQEEN